MIETYGIKTISYNLTLMTKQHQKLSLSVILIQFLLSETLFACTLSADCYWSCVLKLHRILQI